MLALVQPARNLLIALTAGPAMAPAREPSAVDSDAVEALQEQAAQRAAAAAPARAAAAKAAQQSDRRADYTLSLKPRHVGDACASAQALADEWLRGRVKP